MIEFTLSRVCLCVCGITMLAAAIGVMDIVQDDDESYADQELVERIASILDSFERSPMDSVTIDGSLILPTSDHSVRVHQGVVELMHGNRTYLAMTAFQQDLELSYGSTVTVERSVTKGLGDLADGVREDVDLLKAVVQVCRGPRTAIDTT